MVVLADRNFYSFTDFTQAADTDAELLWRVKDTLELPGVQFLADGSYTSLVMAARLSKKRGNRGHDDHLAGLALLRQGDDHSSVGRGCGQGRAFEAVGNSAGPRRPGFQGQRRGSSRGGHDGNPLATTALRGHAGAIRNRGRSEGPRVNYPVPPGSGNFSVRHPGRGLARGVSAYWEAGVDEVALNFTGVCNADGVQRALEELESTVAEARLQ